MNRLAGLAAGLAVLLSGAGCGDKSPPAAPGTGARQAAETFYGGLIAGDAPRAYATLDDDSRRRVSAEQFASLTRAYVKNLGFVANKVYVKACEEHGDAATAHVTLTGRSAGHSRRYSDGITLRLRNDRWGIVLPANFALKTR